MRPKLSSQTNLPPNYFEGLPSQSNQNDVYNYLMRMMNMANNKDDPNMPTYNINRNAL